MAWCRSKLHSICHRSFLGLFQPFGYTNVKILIIYDRGLFSVTLMQRSLTSSILHKFHARWCGAWQWSPQLFIPSESFKSWSATTPYSTPIQYIWQGIIDDLLRCVPGSMPLITRYSDLERIYTTHNPGFENVFNSCGPTFPVYCAHFY